MEIKDLKEEIKKILSMPEYKAGLSIDGIIDQLILNSTIGNEEQIDRDKLKSKVNQILASDVKKKDLKTFSKVINPKTKKERRGWYRIYIKKQQISTSPKPIEINLPPIVESTSLRNSTMFFGKAGECAVMSELLYRGYNVNTMIVDDGVDIIASKNNMFYLLQVKTTMMKDKGIIHASIKKNSFSKNSAFNVRYYIVARCEIANNHTNMFFLFTDKDIENYAFQGALNITENGVNIKIRYDSETRTAILYDKNEINIGFFMNNFNL